MATITNQTVLAFSIVLKKGANRWRGAVVTNSSNFNMSTLAGFSQIEKNTTPYHIAEEKDIIMKIKVIIYLFSVLTSI